MVNVFYVLFIVVVFATTSNGVNFDANFQKVMLSVYYESKCPDSKTFILSQLVPTMKRLSDYIDLKLIPFGKSESIEYGAKGFRCQHGPAECLGNLVQDCTLSQMHSRSDTDRLSYVACEMSSEAGSNGYLDCVQKAKVSPHRVQQCVSSAEGKELQLSSEYLTNRVTPAFVPTIIIDWMFDQQIQDAAIEDLSGTICSMMSENKFCKQYHNEKAFYELMKDSNIYTLDRTEQFIY